MLSATSRGSDWFGACRIWIFQRGRQANRSVGLRGVASIVSRYFSLETMGCLVRDFSREHKAALVVRRERSYAIKSRQRDYVTNGNNGRVFPETVIREW